MVCFPIEQHEVAPSVMILKTAAVVPVPSSSESRPSPFLASLARGAFVCVVVLSQNLGFAGRVRDGRVPFLYAPVPIAQVFPLSWWKAFLVRV